ncbi:hypothetical protein Tco_0036460 [Tanacetum coccineum]
MSDSDESRVTHTEVSSLFEDLSDIGSPRANDYELLEIPYIPEDPYFEAALQAPLSPDYVLGPEEPGHAPPLPNYVPGPEHDDDEIIAEDQPYAEDASPIAQSPDYIPESDLEADPEEDGDEDPEEDPIDYPADRGDDGDDYLLYLPHQHHHYLHAGGFRADYGFVATMDRQVRRDPEREFESLVRRDTDEIYTRLDDEQG